MTKRKQWVNIQNLNRNRLPFFALWLSHRNSCCETGCALDIPFNSISIFIWSACWCWCCWCSCHCAVSHLTYIYYDISTHHVNETELRTHTHKWFICWNGIPYFIFCFSSWAANHQCMCLSISSICSIDF